MIKPRCVNETYPPYPVVSGGVITRRGSGTTYTDPTGHPTSPHSTGTSPPLSISASGTAPGDSGAGTTSAPYGNKTTADPSGTAYSSGSKVYSYSFPSATAIATTRPTTSLSKSSDPSAGTISGKLSTFGNSTGYYPTSTSLPTTTPIYAVTASSSFVTSPSSSDPGTPSVGTTSRFNYTPSVSSFPSEYYTHHGKSTGHYVSHSLDC